MNTDPKDKNVYGENVPTQEAPSAPGIREKVTESDPNKGGHQEAFDATREQASEESENTGGMGRIETPRDGDTQGEWHQSQDS